MVVDSASVTRRSEAETAMALIGTTWRLAVTVKRSAAGVCPAPSAGGLSNRIVSWWPAAGTVAESGRGGRLNTGVWPVIVLPTHLQPDHHATSGSSRR